MGSRAGMTHGRLPPRTGRVARRRSFAFCSEPSASRPRPGSEACRSRTKAAMMWLREPQVVRLAQCASVWQRGGGRLGGNSGRRPSCCVAQRVGGVWLSLAPGASWRPLRCPRASSGEALARARLRQALWDSCTMCFVPFTRSDLGLIGGSTWPSTACCEKGTATAFVDAVAPLQSWELVVHGRMGATRVHPDCPLLLVPPFVTLRAGTIWPLRWVCLGVRK